MSRGRGRGRGQLTFNAEALGIGRGEAPTSALAPPPTYPPLVNKPHPLLTGEDYDFQVQKSNDLIDHMNKHFNLNAAIEAARERFEDTPEDKTSIQKTLSINWSIVPEELTPEYRKRMARKRKLKRKVVSNDKNDVTKRLADLEKREKMKSDDEAEDETKKDSDDDEEDGDKAKQDAKESDEEEVVDEEMDEGTDYANNYFDNGDSYLDDDDDNLDEGGIY